MLPELVQVLLVDPRQRARLDEGQLSHAEPEVLEAPGRAVGRVERRAQQRWRRVLLERALQPPPHTSRQVSYWSGCDLRKIRRRMLSSKGRQGRVLEQILFDSMADRSSRRSRNASIRCEEQNLF